MTNSNSQRNSQYIPYVSINKLDNLVRETPENIILMLGNPQFGFELYLNASTMGIDMIKLLATLVEKILGCNSMQAKLNEYTKRLLQSSFFTKNLYDAISIRHWENGYNMSLIGTTLNILRLIIELNPVFIEHIGPMKDRLELLIRNRLNNHELLRDFEEGTLICLFSKDHQKCVHQQKNSR